MLKNITFKSAPTGKPELDRVFKVLDRFYNGSQGENLGDIQLAAGLCLDFDISLHQASVYIDLWRQQ